MRSCCLAKWMIAVAVAVGVAWSSGAVARFVVSPNGVAKNAYPVEVSLPQVATHPPSVTTSANAATPAPPPAASPAPSPSAVPAASPTGEPSLSSLLASADPAKGEQIAKVCAACHTFDKGGANKVGPNLWGIVGNPRAHLGDGFAYSAAMKSKGGTWGYEELGVYLLKPRDVVPGTKMAYAGLKKLEDRANLIAYLRTLADKPLPLP